MDAQRFDALARSLSSGISRRQIIRLASIFVLVGLRREQGAAAQESTPTATCAPDHVDCNGTCVSLCCDNNNCGACGNVCTGGFTCFEAQCDCPSGLCCDEGETICNGACVATCCDNNNCGGCGIVCSDGLTCFEGTCDCPSGDCPPKLPGTGTGAGSASPGFGPLAALVAATSAAAAIWMRRSTPPTGSTVEIVEVRRDLPDLD